LLSHAAQIRENPIMLNHVTKYVYNT
jgi:hypothetical protein